MSGTNGVEGVRNVLVLNGSPHLSGNGTRMAEWFLEDLAAAGGARELFHREVIHLHDAGFRSCRGCPVCGGLDGCVLAADGCADAMRRVLACDCLVLVSPVHFSSLAAPLVGFISRLQMIWDAPPPSSADGRDRCGALLVSGGSEYPGMFEPSRKVAAAAFRTMNREFVGMVAAPETDDVPVAENRDVREAVRELAERVRARFGE